MSIQQLSTPTLVGGTTTGYPAYINTLKNKINEIALSMAISTLTLSATLGAGSPAADFNAMVAKVNEIIGIQNTTPAQAKPILFLIIGNSISAYGYDSSGNQTRGFSNANTAPGNRVGDYFFSRVTNAGAKMITLGYPGYAFDEWISGKDGINFQQQFQDVITQYGGTYDIRIMVLMGENGFDRFTAPQQINYAKQALAIMKAATGVTAVIMMPTVNRVDQYSYTASGRLFAVDRTEFDQYFLDNQASLGIKVAPKSAAPEMTGDGYPTDTVYCIDGVHPTQLGNKREARIVAAGYSLTPNVSLSAEAADGGLGQAATAANFFAMNAKVTAYPGYVTANSPIDNFAGLAVSQKKLAGNGTLRMVLNILPGASGGMFGIAATKTTVEGYSHLQEAIYFDSDLNRHAYELGTKVGELGMASITNVAVDFILTDSPSNTAMQMCEVVVAGTRLSLRQVPRAQYFLSLALSSGVKASGYYVSGSLIDNT